MRGLFKRRIPLMDRVLVVESGPREVTDKFLRHLYQVQDSRQVDVLTCYGNPPAAFQPERGTILAIHQPLLKRSRRQLINQLAAERYPVVALLCTGSAVMWKWKWVIALRSPSKIVIVNESADFFHLDWRHRRTIQMMISHRAGVTGGLQLGVFAELLMFPFTVTYLLLYAGAVHTRKLFRIRS